MKLSSSFTVYFRPRFYSCNDDIKPSAAFSYRHIKYKIHSPECTKRRHFYFKNSKKFWGGGTAPSPDPNPAGGGHPLPHPSLDLGPAAPRSSCLWRSLTHSEVWLRVCCQQFYFKSNQPTSLKRGVMIGLPMRVID